MKNSKIQSYRGLRHLSEPLCAVQLLCPSSLRLRGPLSVILILHHESPRDLVDAVNIVRVGMQEGTQAMAKSTVYDRNMEK